jgi:E3 ubiquitin-protein ligase HUWE1
MLEFGVTKTIDFCENGRDIALTKENKHEFVRLYVKYILQDSIEAQFNAFKYVSLCLIGT